MSVSTVRRAWWRSTAFRIGILVLIIAVVATIVLVVVLRKKDSEAAAAAQPTVWEQIETSADKNGRTGLDHARQAFAYLFGGLPGVSPPQGRPDPPGFAVSGSGPIRWMLGHWNELTGDQRAAVARFVDLPAEPPKLGGPHLLDLGGGRGDPKDDAQALLTREVKRLTADIGSRLGKTMPDAAVILASADAGPTVRAWSVSLGPGQDAGPLGRGERTGPSGPVKACRVFLPPSLWQHVGGSLSADFQSTVAHELMHCYQGFSYPNTAQYDEAPRWIIEGGAEFGAIDVTHKATGTPGNWQLYLNTRGPLFSRTYTAMGWWFHLQHLKHDPWKAFPGIWSGAQESPAAYKSAGGDADDVYDSWGSSFLRNPGFGDAWEVHGVDVPGDKPPVDTVNAAGGSVVVDAFDARAVQLNVAGPGGTGTMILTLRADQFVRLHDGASYEQARVSNGQYCVGTQCVCPENTKKAGQKIEPQVQAPIWLGISGGESGNKVMTETMTLEEYCEGKNDEKDGSEAGSNGEPHLTSFDGHEYDFQAGGEFTLARSDSGDLEIQTRQEPLKVYGKENLAISVNTAVAARVGTDKVGIYQTPQGLRVRINGAAQAEPQDEQRLPGGGSMVANHGVEVRWPDGTTMNAVPIGEYGLNLLTKPAKSRMRTLHGLLGPYEGVANNPAMEDRSGKRYPSVDRDQLYKVVGDSWRIKQADSLFDYGPGQSTQTFTRKEMPNRFITLADLQAEQKAAGEAACAGITDQKLKQQCIFDVALTGDNKFADGYRSVERIVNRGGIKDGATVSGTIANSDQVDSYQLDLAAGDEFRIADEPNDLKVTLTGTDEHVLPGRIHSLLVTSYRVDAAGSYQLKVAKDSPGPYRFRFVMIKPRRADAKIGDRLAAHLDLPGRVVEYALDSGAASEFRVVADSCEDIWFGIDEDVPELNPGQNLCKPGQPHTFTVEPGKRYVLVIWSGSAKTGDVTFRTERA